MAWKSKYPKYPDLTDGSLGDCRARLDWLDNPFSEEGGIEEEHARYVNEVRLYWASKLALFVEAVDADEPPDPTIMRDLRNAFHDVLSGTVWEDSIPLPGREFKEEWYAYSPKDRRDLGLFRSVQTCVLFGQQVTEGIATVALEKNLSFETVRAAYYKWKQAHVARSKTDTQTLED